MRKRKQRANAVDNQGSCSQRVERNSKLEVGLISHNPEKGTLCESNQSVNAVDTSPVVNGRNWNTTREISERVRVAGILESSGAQGDRDKHTSVTVQGGTTRESYEGVRSGDRRTREGDSVIRKHSLSATHISGERVIAVGSSEGNREEKQRTVTWSCHSDHKQEHKAQKLRESESCGHLAGERDRDTTKKREKREKG